MFHRHAHDLTDDLCADGIETGSDVRTATVQDHGAIRLQLRNCLGMIKPRKSGTLHNHGEALADLHVRIVAGLLHAPLNHVAALQNRFTQAAGADRNNISFAAFAESLQDIEHVPGFHMILQNHILVVAAELLRQFCHTRHKAERSLRSTVSLISAGRRCVGVIHLQVIGHVGAFEKRQGLRAAVHRDRQAMIAVGAGVRAHFHEDARDRTVLLAAHLHTRTHRMAGGVRDELFLPGIAAVHCPACNKGSIGRHILNQNVLLGTVTASDSCLDDMNPVLRESCHPADDSAHMERNLRRRIDSETVPLHPCKADMRLKRRLLYLAGLKGSLHDRVRLGKCLLNIPDAALVRRGNIVVDVRAERELIDHLSVSPVAGILVVFLQIIRSTCAVFDNPVVHARSALRHRLFNREDGF